MYGTGCIPHYCSHWKAFHCVNWCLVCSASDRRWFFFVRIFSGEFRKKSAYRESLERSSPFQTEPQGNTASAVSKNLPPFSHLQTLNIVFRIISESRNRVVVKLTIPSRTKRAVKQRIYYYKTISYHIISFVVVVVIVVMAVRKHVTC